MPRMALSLPAELEGRAGLAVARLRDVSVGVLTELEETVSVAGAHLLERAGMAVAFLMHDAQIATSVLCEAGLVVHAVLADLATVLHTLEKRIEPECGGKRQRVLRIRRIVAHRKGTSGGCRSRQNGSAECCCCKSLQGSARHL